MASMNETTTTGLQPRKGRLQRFLPRPVPGTYSSPNSQAEGQGLQGFDKHNTLLSREMAENKERRLLDMKAATSKSKSGLKEQEAQQNQNIIESTVRSEPGTLISRAHNVTSFISESQLEAINDQTTSSSSAAAASYSGAIAVASSSSSRRSKPSAARNLSMLHLLPIIPINTSGESQETKEPPAVVRKLSNLGSLTWNVLPSIKTSVAASKGTFLQRDSVAAVISINHAANHHHQADGGEGDGGASGADDCLLSSSPQYSQLARTTETSTVGNSIINKAGSETPSSSGVIAGVSQPVRLHNLPSSSRYNAAAATALFNSSPGRNAGGPTRPTSRLTMQQPSPAGRSNSLLLLSSMSSCSELLAGDCTISDAGCSASRRQSGAGVAGGGAAAGVTDGSLGSLASPKLISYAAALPPATLFMSSSNSEIRSGRSIPTTRENDLLKIASRMGMVRKGLSDPRLDLRAPSAARPPGARSAHPTREQMSAWRLMSRAHSNNTESQVSLLGVQYSVLLQFAANIQNDVSTQEVVHNHIMKQTSDQKNRYLDIISDTAIEVPEFYVIHPWSMNFKGLVDVLGSYFSSCKLHPEEAYIWIDIFCVNHHNMPLCPTDFSTVGEVIGKCTKTLFVLDEEGKALSQEWIQYQLFQVHHASFPTSSSSGGRRDDRLVVLPTSWDWRAMHFAYDLMEISAEHPQILPSDSEVMSLDEGASQALQMSMAAYGSSADRHHDSVRKLKETMLLGAKRELQRSEKLASVNPQRYFECATAVALLQYLNAELADAEETLHSISVLMDKVNSHLVRSENESKRLYHLSLVFHQKGQLIETMYTLKVLLGSSTSSSTSTWSEVHLQGMSLMVECLCLSKEYTKAELLCRKLIEKRNDWHHQKYDAGAVEDKLLMGNISSAQHLHEEATERCMDALSMAVQISGEDSLLAAKCNQSIAGISLCTSHFKLDPTLYVSKALTTYDRHLGGTHPLLLSCKVLMSKLLIRKNQLAEAESLLSAVLESQLRWYGIEHHDTLEALGLHVDVLRSMGKEEEAATAEKRIIHAGKALLSGRRLDRFKSLSYVSEFLTSREHLLEKAGLHLVRAYSVYKEKLGSDADLTVSTRTQLDDVIQRVRSTGLETLENAQLYGRQDLFKTAETLLNRCWSISKLLHTDANYKGIAESLADALLGQGKAQEAKAVLKAAGLVKKGMTDNMPASYLRWLNKRVAHFMDISAAAASAED